MTSPQEDLDFPPGSGIELVDLGGGAWYSRVVNKDGVWIGINEWHRHPTTGQWCGGWVAFDIPECTWTSRWQVRSFDPLDLSPSLLCTTCQHHGFIRGGRWSSC